jgi:hypothetical protein
MTPFSRKTDQGGTELNCGLKERIKELAEGGRRFGEIDRHEQQRG